jgi:SAM-dependent methyltransferase
MSDPGEVVARQWDRSAGVYDAVVGAALGDCHRALLARVGEVDGRDVLDVGCGTGRVAALAAERGARVTAIDVSAEMVALARRAPALAGARVEVMDAQDLALPDASFDAVVASFSIMFCPDPGAAMSEARRVLRPGGRFAATAWCPAEECEHTQVSAAALAAAGAPDLPGVPTGQSLSEPGLMGRLAEATGLRDVVVEKRRFALRYPGAGATWRAVRVVYAHRLPEDRLADAERATLEAVARLGLPLRSSAWVLTARA